MSLVELETKKNVKVTWMGLHNKEEVRETMTLELA